MIACSKMNCSQGNIKIRAKLIDRQLKHIVAREMHIEIAYQNLAIYDNSHAQIKTPPPENLISSHAASS